MVGKDFQKCILYTDGASRGKPPGISSIGIVLCDEYGNVLLERAEHIGRTTNNVAEYTALLKGLEVARGYQEVEHYSDSKLMVHQVNGEWKIKCEHLHDLVQMVKEAEKDFGRVSHAWVPRTNQMIALADRLANEVLDSEKTWAGNNTKPRVKRITQSGHEVSRPARRRDKMVEPYEGSPEEEADIAQASLATLFPDEIAGPGVPSLAQLKREEVEGE